MREVLHRITERLRRLFSLLPAAEEETLSHMNRVDAALLRKPRLAPVLLSVVTFVAIAFFLLWASMARVDEVARGQGQVISSQRNQVVENLEGGIVREILVREGQIVNKDQVLLRLDNETAESVFRDAVNKIQEGQAAITRLDAELRGQTPEFDQGLRAKAPQVVRDQQTLFERRREQRQAELGVLEYQYKQKMHEVEDLLARQHEMNASLAVQQRQVEIARQLYQQKNFSEMNYLDLQQKLITLQGNVESLAVSLPKAEAAAAEARQKAAGRKAEMESQIAEEMNKRRSELASLEQTLAAGSDRVVRKDIRSPVRGTIKQIMNNTVGGVVRPGQPIMEIVPLDDSLVIEARIKPSDVAFIRPQQRATVRITAYDSSIYGSLPGQVEHISADTIEDRRGEVYYNVRVRTRDNAITHRDKQLPIIPGMIATVDILTGQKTIMDYILKPILKAGQNALHER